MGYKNEVIGPLRKLIQGPQQTKNERKWPKLWHFQLFFFLYDNKMQNNLFTYCHLVQKNWIWIEVKLRTPCRSLQRAQKTQKWSKIAKIFIFSEVLLLCQLNGLLHLHAVHGKIMPFIHLIIFFIHSFFHSFMCSF